MKFLFASDSFKGTLSSKRITALLGEFAGRIFPDCETAGMPVADGGERTIDTAVSALNGTYRRLTVHGPPMEECESFYGEFEGNSAVIGMMTASGLPMVPVEKRNPLSTTTYGTRELIRDVLDRGCRKISIAIGGSATDDGGTGAMRVLGMKSLSSRGNELEGKGKGLTKAADVVVGGLHHGVAQTGFTVMCDVTNPLTGSDGATYTFGKQKGGTPEILDIMEGGMIRYIALIKGKLDMDVDRIPGSETAGGLGAAFCVFLKANLKSGIGTVLDLVHFSELLEGVDLVVTGEDRVDWQSAFDRVPSDIGQRCKERGIPVVAIVGDMGHKAEAIFGHGVDNIMVAINGTMEPEETLDHSEELYVSAADRVFRVLKTGMSLG